MNESTSDPDRVQIKSSKYLKKLHLLLILMLESERFRTINLPKSEILKKSELKEKKRFFKFGKSEFRQKVKESHPCERYASYCPHASLHHKFLHGQC